ncbi:MAG TPA: TonB C-terminal domain-containing protein [Candidatus Babeliaceae bacterium]|nr:TonB C-terminal domain-containing protein [Candidatus Babeliaceae bacterium]
MYPAKAPTISFMASAKGFINKAAASKEVTTAGYSNVSAKALKLQQPKKKIALPLKRTITKKISKPKPMQSKQISKPLPQKTKALEKQVPKALEKAKEAPIQIIQPTGPVTAATIAQELPCLNQEADHCQEMEERIIKQEVQRYWSPPRGIVKKSDCIISFTINSLGRASDIKLMQSSGIRSYDVSAREAVMRSKYSLAVYNRSITLNF